METEKIKELYENSRVAREIIDKTLQRRGKVQIPRLLYVSHEDTLPLTLESAKYFGEASIHTVIHGNAYSDTFGIRNKVFVGRPLFYKNRPDGGANEDIFLAESIHGEIISNLTLEIILKENLDLEGESIRPKTGKVRFGEDILPYGGGGDGEALMCRTYVFTKK